MDPITLAILGGLGAYLLSRASSGPSSSSSDRFTYRKKGSSWRAYFNGNPPSRSHVLRDGDGYYVCWNKPLRTMEEAQRVARRWMETYG